MSLYWSGSSSATTTCLSDYPGPLLLVLPQSGLTPGNPKSCDARLLWKPQTMMHVGGTFKRLFLQSMGHVITGTVWLGIHSIIEWAIIYVLYVATDRGDNSAPHNMSRFVCTIVAIKKVYSKLLQREGGLVL